MLDSIEIPSFDEIQDAPHKGVLAVLEHMLSVASTCLEVEHHSLGQLSEWYEGMLPPRQVLLADLIVTRCSELRGLIAWYRRSCPRALTNRPMREDDVAENDPF